MTPHHDDHRNYRTIGAGSFDRALQDRRLPVRGRLDATPWFPVVQTPPVTPSDEIRWSSAICIGTTAIQVATTLGDAMQASGAGHEPPRIEALVERARVDVGRQRWADVSWSAEEDGDTVLTLTATYDLAGPADWRVTLSYWRAASDGAMFARTACAAHDEPVEALRLLESELHERHPDLRMPLPDEPRDSTSLTASGAPRSVVAHWWMLDAPRAGSHDWPAP